MARQDISEMGGGRVWSIANAQNIAFVGSFDLGIEQCGDLVVQATDIVQEHRLYRKEIFEVTRYARASKKIIDIWQESEGATVETTHPDLATDIKVWRGGSGRPFYLGGKSFDSTANSMGVAKAKIRVVRMAVPELLRGRKPAELGRQSQDYLSYLNESLETLTARY